MSDEAKPAPDIETLSPRARRARLDRDRRFLDAYFSNGMVVCEAEILVSPHLAKDRGAASRQGSRRLRRLRESSEWTELLQAGGLDDLSLIAKARELLEARQTLIDSEGNEHEVADNRTRLGALQTVGKWKGKEKNIVELPNGPLEVRVTHNTEGI